MVKIKIPPSKSVAHRAILGASLANGESIIHNIDMSEDIKATLECVINLGAKSHMDNGKLYINGTNMLKINHEVTLDANESGSTLRFMIPISLLTGQKVTFIGKGKLMERPQGPYFDLFEEKNITYNHTKEKLEVQGKLVPGQYILPGNVSSQFVTGLLFALPKLQAKSEIILSTQLESVRIHRFNFRCTKRFWFENRKSKSPKIYHITV